MFISKPLNIYKLETLTAGLERLAFLTVKCRKKFMLAQVQINQPNDALAYLNIRRSFQPLQLALLPEPASKARDAQKAAQYVFSALILLHIA